MKFWESHGMTSRSLSGRIRIGRRSLILASAAIAASAGFVLYPGVFTITDVRFIGCGSVPRDSLDSVRIGLVGRNLVVFSTGWARARLLSFPEVESVAFKRCFLHTLECHLKKREPVALLVAGSLMEVDREGVVIPRRAGRGDIDLPVITGIAERSLRKEEGERSLARAVEVLRLFRAEGFSPAAQLSEIHLEGEDVDLVWMGTGTVIRLGREEYARRIRKLKAVSTVLSDRERFPDLIDLRFERQVIIR